MTILHMTAPARFGGLERVVQALAAGQRRAGHCVHVAAVVSNEGAEHAAFAPLVEEGVEVHALRLDGRRYLLERRLLRDLCRRIRPTVVHTHGYRSDVIGGGVARALGIPNMTTVHGFTRGGWKNRLYETLQRRAFRGFDAVVAVSRPQVAELTRAGVRAERIHLVPNAWSGRRIRWEEREAVRARLAIEPHAFHIGWVGRLGHEKGPDVLIDALPALRDLPIVVSMVGDGRMRPELEARAARAGVADRIRWHGAVDDAAPLFRAFDAFVLSSRTEGTPIVLFEAMAAGTPIIATRVGGVPDVVSTAEAVLVPPGAPAALADAIRGLHADPAAALARATAATRRLGTDFAVDGWLARYDALYRRLGRDGKAR